MVSSLVELREMMKTTSEGIQSVREKMEEQKKVDVACYQALLDIQRSLQDLVWKSTLETRSGRESVDGSQELLELVKEREEFQRKVLELEKEAEEVEMVDLTLT